MDRLTIRYPDGAVELKCSVNDAVMRLAAYEDTGLEPEEIAELTKSLLAGMNKRNRAMELLQAESEGRLIFPPCKVGDTVYKPFLRPLSVVPMVVLRIVQDGIDNQIIVDGGRSFCFSDIGKTIFLNPDEAEAALGGDVDG